MALLWTRSNASMSSFVLRAPELGAGLQVGSDESGVKGQNHLPRPAGHASLDAAQDAVGFLSCEHTLSAHQQLFIHQSPQSFSAGLLSIPSCFGGLVHGTFQYSQILLFTV